MKLIDVDVACESINDYDRYSGTSLELEDVESILREQNIIDPVYAAGACYCIECKHRNKSKGLLNGKCLCLLNQMRMHINGFCSFGQKE